jgi:hypothetical protein
MKPILQFKSLNLRGETRKEEKHRILHERIEAIRQNKSREEINEIGGWRASLFGFKTSEKNKINPIDRVYKKYDYCPRCCKRTEHIKHSNVKMCKTCGFQEKC